MDNLNVLTPLESKPSQTPAHIEWIINQIAGLAVALGAEVTTERLGIYAKELSDLSQQQLQLGFWRLVREWKWKTFPQIAEIREMSCSVADGRPGPEEAWARMPKGERMELDTIIWCEEEHAAYSAARPLLVSGDEIAARMCFLERYRQAITASRTSGKKVRWTVSAGYDHDDRVVKLALAVEQNKIALPHAYQFVPWDKTDEFKNMLAGAKTAGLLQGETTKLLPGFDGLLQKLRMDGEIDPQALPDSQPKAEPLTPAELANRKRTLRQQAADLKVKSARS